MALKKSKMSIEKIMYSGNSKSGKMKNQMYQNNTVIGWLPSLKKHFYIVFYFKTPRFFKKALKKVALLSCQGSDPPLAKFPAKNASFFDVLPYRPLYLRMVMRCIPGSPSLHYPAS